MLVPGLKVGCLRRQLGYRWVRAKNFDPAVVAITGDVDAMPSYTIKTAFTLTAYTARVLSACILRANGRALRERNSLS
jgi:hypothetical protein